MTFLTHNLMRTHMSTAARHSESRRRYRSLGLQAILLCQITSAMFYIGCRGSNEEQTDAMPIAKWGGEAVPGVYEGYNQWGNAYVRLLLQENRTGLIALSFLNDTARVSTVEWKIERPRHLRVSPPVDSDFFYTSLDAHFVGNKPRDAIQLTGYILDGDDHYVLGRQESLLAARESTQRSIEAYEKATQARSLTPVGSQSAVER